MQILQSLLDIGIGESEVGLFENLITGEISGHRERETESNENDKLSRLGHVPSPEPRSRCPYPRGAPSGCAGPRRADFAQAEAGV